MDKTHHGPDKSGKSAHQIPKSRAHHEDAAFHHDTAAHHHRQAGRHRASGNHEAADRHAEAATAHERAAEEHATAARAQRGFDDVAANGGASSTDGADEGNGGGRFQSGEEYQDEQRNRGRA